MKIALICTEKLPVPPIAGGAVQLYIEGIVPYLSGTHDITVFSIQYPGLPEREVRNNVKYIRVPGGSNKIYVNSLRTALDSSYDLIHVLNRPRYVLELMDAFPDVRFSLSLHNEMFHPEKLSDEEGIKCINRVEFINTVSKYISSTVADRFPIARDKLHVVYSGVNTSLYEPVWSNEGQQLKKKFKAMYGLQDYKVVLFVGRLSVKKGVDVLLNAMNMVMRSNFKTALVIIGSKWYGKNESDDYTVSLQALSKSIAGPIVFTGFVPPADIPRLYNIGDVFVCASQWNEPLARVHYEAMAAGLPIITTNRGGNAEVIQGYGNGIVLDDYSNPANMAHYISELLKNEAACLRMGTIGRRLAEERYNWKRVADEVFERLPSEFKTGAYDQVKTPPGEKPVPKPAVFVNDKAKTAGAPAMAPISQVCSETAINSAISAAQAAQHTYFAATIQSATTAAVSKVPVSSTPEKAVMLSATKATIPAAATNSAANTPAISQTNSTTVIQSAISAGNQSTTLSFTSDNTKPVIKQKEVLQSVSVKTPSLASFMKRPEVSPSPVPCSVGASSSSHESDFWLPGEVKSSDPQQVTLKSALTIQPQTEVKQKQKPQTCSLADFTSGSLWNKAFQ